MPARDRFWRTTGWGDAKAVHRFVEGQAPTCRSRSIGIVPSMSIATPDTLPREDFGEELALVGRIVDDEYPSAMQVGHDFNGLDDRLDERQSKSEAAMCPRRTAVF